MRDAHPWIKNDFRLPEGEEAPRTLCKWQPGRYRPYLRTNGYSIDMPKSGR